MRGFGAVAGGIRPVGKPVRHRRLPPTLPPPAAAPALVFAPRQDHGACLASASGSPPDGWSGARNATTCGTEGAWARRCSFARRSEPAVVRRIASSPPAEAHLGKRERLMLPWEFRRLAEPIPELWNGRQSAVDDVASPRRLVCERNRQLRTGTSPAWFSRACICTATPSFARRWRHSKFRRLLPSPSSSRKTRRSGTTPLPGLRSRVRARPSRYLRCSATAGRSSSPASVTSPTWRPSG
jgi:hypothetical protein